MTVDEKKENPNFYVTKGYLKKYNYKTAWKNAWNLAKEETKHAIKNIPNFDAVVFYDITGIDLSVDTDKIKQEMIEEAEKLLKAGRDLLEKAKGIV